MCGNNCWIIILILLLCGGFNGCGTSCASNNNCCQNDNCGCC